jgi:hypothetical protein
MTGDPTTRDVLSEEIRRVKRQKVAAKHAVEKSTAKHKALVERLSDLEWKVGRAKRAEEQEAYDDFAAVLYWRFLAAGSPTYKQIADETGHPYALVRNAIQHWHEHRHALAREREALTVGWQQLQVLEAFEATMRGVLAIAALRLRPAELDDGLLEVWRCESAGLDPERHDDTMRWAHIAGIEIPPLAPPRRYV